MRVRTQTAMASFWASYHRSSTVRWVVVSVALLVAWLIFFWLLNLPSGSSQAPTVTTVPTNAV